MKQMHLFSRTMVAAAVFVGCLAMAGGTADAAGRHGSGCRNRAWSECETWSECPSRTEMESEMWSGCHNREWSDCRNRAEAGSDCPDRAGMECEANPDCPNITNAACKRAADCPNKAAGNRADVQERLGAAKKTSKVKTKTGTYNGRSRVLVVYKVTNKKITFVIGYTAMREAMTKKITANIKNNKVKFHFKDDWGASGTGTLYLHKKSVDFKTNDSNSLISTGGKKFKLNWVTKKKKFFYYAKD